MLDKYYYSEEVA